jgi:hypothetical protein
MADGTRRSVRAWRRRTRSGWSLSAVLVALVLGVAGGIGLALPAAAVTSGHDTASARPALGAHVFAGYPGYWLFGRDGAVYAAGAGADDTLGDLTGVVLAAPIVGGAPAVDGDGYYEVGPMVASTRSVMPPSSDRPERSS